MARYGLHGAIRAHPGRGEELLDHLLEAARIVEHARGCGLYLVSRDADDPDTVWITEAWASRADHDASLGLPAIRELIGRARELIAGMGPSHAFLPAGGFGIDAGHDATEPVDQSSAGGG